MFSYRTSPGLLCNLALLCSIAGCAFGGVKIYPVPAEIRSDRFSASLDGQAADVVHAATTYHCLSFDLDGATQISITASSDDYWARGVEVQPWRLNIRPVIHGRTITFKLDSPAKLSITRPGDHLAGAEMLFVFANAPEHGVPKRGDAHVRFYAPGVYHEYIDAHSGDTIYLAAGAVVFGGINVWGAENVRVLGRGMVIYEGPQNPLKEESWIHKPNWHVIVMDHARNVEINGITCIVRSRAWMIQMLGSHFIKYDNVKVIGGNSANANQDGMDWLGGGDTLVTDCFFRASDDIFALYGNWLGYTPADLATPGEDVRNIRIERCVLSTSISNVVRVNWPHKVFNSGNFFLSDSDVIHMGVGGCGVPFALLDLWADPEGKGQHNGYRFEDIRLEDWYSLVQIYQANAAVRDVQFTRVWALDQPQLVPSTLSGDVKGVTLTDTPDGEVDVKDGAQAPAVHRKTGSFVYSPSDVRVGSQVTFDASKFDPAALNFEWLFGDGTSATGAVVQHVFNDAEGTVRDGSGRFRVLLKTADADGHVRWTGSDVVVTGDSGASDVVFDRDLDVAATGGYTFLLTARDTAEIQVDGQVIARSGASVPQVCGSVGNAAQLIRGSVHLDAGRHHVRATAANLAGSDVRRFRWEGPGIRSELN